MVGIPLASLGPLPGFITLPSGSTCRMAVFRAKTSAFRVWGNGVTWNSSGKAYKETTLSDVNSNQNDKDKKYAAHQREQLRN